MPYTTRQVADMAGLSRATVRMYGSKYRDLLSPGAQPESGMQRNFNDADVRLLRFVFERTQAGRTHEQVVEDIRAGELDRFEWQPAPPAAEPEPQRHESAVVEVDEEQEQTTALVPVAQLHAALTLLDDARRREEEARDEVAKLRDQVTTLSMELGQAKGALGERRTYRAPAWVRVLFGGRE